MEQVLISCRKYEEGRRAVMAGLQRTGRVEARIKDVGAQTEKERKSIFMFLITTGPFVYSQ